MRAKTLMMDKSLWCAVVLSGVMLSVPFAAHAGKGGGLGAVKPLSPIFTGAVKGSPTSPTKPIPPKGPKPGFPRIDLKPKPPTLGTPTPGRHYPFVPMKKPPVIRLTPTFNAAAKLKK